MTKQSRKWIENYNTIQLRNLLSYKNIPYTETDSDAVLRMKYFEDVNGFALVLFDKEEQEYFDVECDTHGHTIETATAYARDNFPKCEIISIKKKVFKYGERHDTYTSIQQSL